MHRKTFISSFLLMAFLCVGLVPKAVAQESVGEQVDVDKRYKALTKQAARAYRQKEFDNALELFEEAYAMKQVPNLLYNMGRIHEKRGDFDAAIENYEKFVTKPDVDIKARRDALGRLKTLREVVALRQEGEDIDEEKIQEKHEDRELVEADQPTRGPKLTNNYVPAWVTLGTAVAAYGTSGFFALRARDANADFESADSRELRRDASSRGETSAIFADSTLAAGVLLTAVSVYFFVSPPTSEAAPDGTTVQLSPQLGSDSAGVSMNLTF